MAEATLMTCISSLPMPVIAGVCFFGLKAKKPAAVLMLCWSYAMVLQLITFLLVWFGVQ